MVRVERSEVNYLSDDMMLQIMESYGIEDHYKRAFLFYFDTGCRLFEPFNGYIKVNMLMIPPDKAKTHRRRTVHLTGITLNILHEMCERVDNCIGKRRFAIKNYSRVFKKACRTVGISDKYHFHNLRDTYAVRRWAVTGDIHLVSKEIGHKSVMTTERYADFDLESLLLDFKSLEKWIAPRLKKPTIDGFFLNALNTAIIPPEDTILEDTTIL
jgi:integrase